MIEMGMESFGQRLKSAIGDESVNSFAVRCGVSEGSIRNYLNDKFPGSDIALRIADAANVDLEWLVSGRGSRVRPTSVAAASNPELSTQVARLAAIGDLALVPRLEVYASAGHGALSVGETVIDLIAFPREWLRSHKINPDHARILTARGDSMEETIRNGDLLIVDTALDFFRDNGIYVVVSGEMVLVKRVHRRMNGSCQLISDNPRYPTEELTAGEAEELHVAGRVMWYGRSM